MASYKKITDAGGATVYKVQVSNGRGRKVTRSWRPEPGWSAKTIKRELDKFAANLENELAEGTLKTRQEDLEERRLAALEAAKIKTLRQYADGVFMPAKEATFSENSRSNYRQCLDKHILPVLGDFPMRDITPSMLTKLLLDFQKSGKAHSSAVKLYNILNGVFKMTFLDDSIQENPMLRVTRPKPRKNEHVKEESEKAYTVQQLRHILKCLDNEPLKWQAYINLVADTGMRRGEACGLQWTDVDFKKGCITIRRNLQYTSAAGIYEDTPKSRKSRPIDIGPDVVKLLRQLQTEQSSKCISKWIFTQDGSADPMHPQSPTRYFKKFGQRYGVEDFHPHKLRHTSASLALTNGADVVSVSERLGHSDTAVTLRMYAHANEESIRRAGQVVRDALKAEGE